MRDILYSYGIISQICLRHSGEKRSFPYPFTEMDGVVIR